MKKPTRIAILQILEEYFDDYDSDAIKEGLIKNGYIEKNSLIFQLTERKNTFVWTVQVPKRMVKE